MTADPLPGLKRALATPAAPSSDFDLDADAAPARPSMRPAAVLVAVHLRDERAEMILTRRAARLAHHAGQVAFPGGKIDPGDTGPEAAALREAGEEIGLPAGAVNVLGTMPAHLTVTGYHVTPVIGLVAGGFSPRPADGEVAEVFSVPFAHLADAANYTVEARRWRGRWRHYYTVPWGPYYIWGATARILHSLASGMAR